MSLEEKFEKVRLMYNRAIENEDMELAKDMGKELKLLNKLILRKELSMK